MREFFLKRKKFRMRTKFLNGNGGQSNLDDVAYM